MKKIMILAAIAFAAIASQAASIKWSTGSIWAVNADGAWDTAVAGKNAPGTFAFAVSVYDSTGTTLLETINQATFSMSKAGGSSTRTDYAANTTYKVALSGTYTTSAGVQTFTATDAVDFTMPGNGNGTANFTTLCVVSSSATQWTPLEEPEPTPEPTSALLLLLGVAGLALKRKNA